MVSPEVMPGRLTGVARHLEEPERKVYIATMEEGFYELDLETLEVVELYPDDQGQLRGADVERAVGIPGRASRQEVCGVLPGAGRAGRDASFPGREVCGVPRGRGRRGGAVW